MKIKSIFSCLLISLHVFSQDKNDSAAIVKLPVDDYKTMRKWDMKKESEYYRTNAHRIIDRKDYFDIKFITVFGNRAYAVYGLKFDIVENGNLKTKN